MDFKFDIIKFKKNIILGIKKSFESIKEDNDHIYCYSLVVSSELSCIGAAANTIDYLKENIDDEDETIYYKFCEQEWEFYNEYLYGSGTDRKSVV